MDAKIYPIFETSKMFNKKILVKEKGYTLLPGWCSPKH